MSRVVVIGAGIMGLAAAHEALRLGHDVTVFEAAPQAGGMAAHMMVGDMSTERFYHFVCKTDFPTFDLLRDLGIIGKLRWVGTSMGYFTHGRLYRWGDPIALLRFPHLSLIQKIRYGLLSYISTRRNRWDALEQQSARAWLTRWCGKSGYDQMWSKLFEQKFFEYTDHVSAAWMWTRIRRVGRSRRSLMQEELGYIEGGSETLVAAMMDAIAHAGGTVHLGRPATRIDTHEGQVTAVTAGSETVPADAVICTVPTPLIPDLVPDLAEDAKDAYGKIVNIGAVCVVMALERSITRHFWVNINEADIEVPGVIEFSNLRPASSHIVYIPYYMPTNLPKWSWSDEAFIKDAFLVLKRINPSLQQSDVQHAHVNRLRHAQPVCPPGFKATLPAIQTAIGGLQIADTCFYYPEDRGIAESIRIGQSMAQAIVAP